MPTDPNWKYVDTAHEKTVIDDSYRYGCNTVKTGKKFHHITTYQAAPWAKNPLPQFVRTKWLDKQCPHDAKNTDPHCRECAERNQEFHQPQSTEVLQTKEEAS